MKKLWWTTSVFYFSFAYSLAHGMEPILQYPPKDSHARKRVQVCMEVDSSESAISDQEQTLLIKGHGKWRKNSKKNWRSGPLELLWKQEEGVSTMSRFKECREIVQRLAFLKGTPDQKSLVLQLTLSEPGKWKNKTWNLQAFSPKDIENTCRPLGESTLLDECKK